MAIRVAVGLGNTETRAISIREAISTTETRAISIREAILTTETREILAPPVVAPLTPWGFFVSQVGDFAIQFTAVADDSDRYQYLDVGNGIDTSQIIAAHPSDMFTNNATQRIGRLWHSTLGGTIQHVATHRRGGGVAWPTFMASMGNEAAVYLINETAEEYIIFDMSDSVDGSIPTRPGGASDNFCNWNVTDVEDGLIARVPDSHTDNFLGALGGDQVIFAFSRQRDYRPYS